MKECDKRKSRISSNFFTLNIIIEADISDTMQALSLSLSHTRMYFHGTSLYVVAITIIYIISDSSAWIRRFLSAFTHTHTHAHTRTHTHAHAHRLFYNTTTVDLQSGVSVCALFRASVCMYSFLNI